MMNRKIVVGLLLVALGVATAALSNGSFSPASTSQDQVAARWYHRARQGNLHYRSTTSGRSIPHTAVPRSIQYYRVW